MLKQRDSTANAETAVTLISRHAHDADHNLNRASKECTRTRDTPAKSAPQQTTRWPSLPPSPSLPTCVSRWAKFRDVDAKTSAADVFCMMKPGVHVCGCACARLHIRPMLHRHECVQTPCRTHLDTIRASERTLTKVFPAGRYVPQVCEAPHEIEVNVPPSSTTPLLSRLSQFCAWPCSFNPQQSTCPERLIAQLW